MRDFFRFFRLPLYFGFCCLLFGFLFSACKSKPETLPVVLPPTVTGETSAFLLLKNIEASRLTQVNLFFDAVVQESLSQDDRAKIESWRAELNGQSVASGVRLDYPEGDILRLKASGGESASLPIILNIDMAALSSQGLLAEDECQVKLIIELGFYQAGNSSPAARVVEVSCPAAFPGVKEPTFSITAIAILKAELINTRFRVSIKIDNPNPFPLELSAFTYELFGNGRSWASGRETNILRVNGKSSLSGDLYLLMNFIDMDRALLDQIINLADVNYRFTGAARVGTGIAFLPVFDTSFNLSGYSKVLDR